MTLDELLRIVAGLQTDEVEVWIARAWLRPSGEPGAYEFEDIDVARVRLLVLLRTELAIAPDTLPVVLSLIDQLHDTRRQLRATYHAIIETLPAETRLELSQRIWRSMS